MEWEIIDGSRGTAKDLITERVHIYDIGWLVRTYRLNEVCNIIPESLSITFVPDKNQDWEVD